MKKIKLNLNEMTNVMSEMELKNVLGGTNPCPSGFWYNSQGACLAIWR